MSTPTTRSFASAEGGTPYEVNGFVAAVRSHLDDLSVDEVTELTGGLEADLTDALAEADSSLSQLYGDPAEYAGELRAAAGLPPRGAVAEAPREPGLGLAARLEQDFIVPMQEAMQKVVERLDLQPWWPGVRDFLVSIRPAWWVLRAWVVVEGFFMVAGVGDSVVRGGFGGLVLLLAAIVVSVQLARQAPLPATWLRVLVAAWSLGAALLLLPLLFASTGSQNIISDGSGLELDSLSIDGEAIHNVFPYDSAGRPLTGVQLFDQNGRPLEIGEGDRGYWDDDTGISMELVPGSPVGSAPRWNAFPLQVRRNDVATDEPGPVEPAPLPLTGVPSQPGEPTSTSGPTPSASSAPSPSATATPSASPSASTGKHKDDAKSK